MLKSLNSDGSLPGQFRSLQLKLIDQTLQFRGPGACDAFGSNRRFRPRLGSALLICKHLGPGKKGAIFRRLWKQRVGPALSPAAVGEIVQRRARLAGLEGDFGGPSLRSGFVTEASRQGVSLPAIMQLTEHRSV